MNVPMPRLYLSAAHKSSGKTTVSLGLCAALAARGLAVQPFKKGPDYIDPMWLGLAAGRPCHNLDFQTQTTVEIDALFDRLATRADVSLIEGNKGLYDGLDVRGSNSNAALAVRLGTPVVLVLDVAGTIRGVAPLLLGYQAFDRAVNIGGVIFNKVGGARHEAKLRDVCATYTDIPVLGAIHRDAGLAITERHLGLVPSNEADAANARIARIGAAVGRQVDLDALLALAHTAPPRPQSASGKVQPQAPERVRIAVARDRAFGFYYAGDWEALKRAGAEIVAFDTLRDARLPPCDGLFIGGGFPETAMAELEANAALRADIRARIEAGLPAYAECGGLMYLARRIRWKERSCEMVGVLPADVEMGERPVGKGYVRLRERGAMPWRPGPAPEFDAHEFHYSRLADVAPGLTYAYEVVRGTGCGDGQDGIVHRNLLASYAHLRDTARTPWATRFVEFVRRCRAAHTANAAGGI